MKTLGEKVDKILEIGKVLREAQDIKKFKKHMNAELSHIDKDLDGARKYFETLITMMKRLDPSKSGKYMIMSRDFNAHMHHVTEISKLLKFSIKDLEETPK